MPTHQLVAALAAVVLAQGAYAQAPDAGPDATIAWPNALQLNASVVGRAPLEWWTADGNNATEDMLVRASEIKGTLAVGPLRTAAGTALGWPGDLVEINGVLWGIDVGQRRLYTLDPTSGIGTLIGSSAFAVRYTSVNSLAYDAVNDRLFGVDTAKKQLLTFNRATGQVTDVGGTTLVGYPLVRSLAYDAASDRLFAQDTSSGWLLSIHPTTGVVTRSAWLMPNSSWRVEELEFFGGELFASRGLFSMGILSSGQLARLDRTSGAYADIGAPLLEVSPHCLHVVSVPERVQWSVLSGSGSATFSDATALDSQVTFGAAGVYVLELTVYTANGALSDSVVVTADGCPSDPLEILPGNCHPNGTAYCSGDGSGTACPCGNAAAAGEGCANSTQVGARLANSGGTSVSSDDAVLVASGMPSDQAGVIYMGTQSKNGLFGTHWGDGLRCVAGQTQRFALADSGSAGAFSVVGPVASSGGAIGAGTTWYFQAWYRDGASVCGGHTNTSNGLAITFAP